MVTYFLIRDNILTDKEMKLLFRDISKGKEHFNFEDFRSIYEKKPILLSWIDYFKKDEAEMLPNVDESIKELLTLQFKFFNKFGNIIHDTIALNGNQFNFNTAIFQIERFCKLFEKQKQKIEKYKSRINIRKIIEKLKAPKKSTHDYKVKKRADIGFPNNLKKISFNKFEENKRTEEDDLKIDEDMNSVKNNDLKKSSKVKLAKIEEIEESKDVTLNNINRMEMNVNDQLCFLKHTITKMSYPEDKGKFDYNKDYFEEENEKNSFSSSLIDEVNNEDCLDEKEIELIQKKIGKTQLVIDKISEEKYEKNFDENKPILSKIYEIKDKNSETNLELEENRNYCNTIKLKTINNSDYAKLDSSFLNSNEFEKYNNQIKQFLNKLKTLCEINIQSNLIALNLYSLISRKFINPNKQKDKNKSADDFRISKVNIPKRASFMENKKLKNKILNPGDSNFKILLTMIMGVQKTVQSTPNIEIDSTKDLTVYIKSLKYSLGEAFLNLEEQYYIKDYGGIIFNSIRKLYDIDIMSYIGSISPQDIITEIMISYTTNIEQLCSTGSSGSLFYYTRDAKYIMKTIPQREFEVLKRILPNYYRYLKENKWTLLPKFFGCYKLVKKVKKEKKRFYFIIMDNLFSTNKEINLRYDIKGSTIGRKVLKDGIKYNPKEKYDYAFKDLDLEENHHLFNIGHKKAVLFEQLKKDSEFLRENNIIDYSLLIGTHIIEYDRKLSSLNSENNVLPNKEIIEDLKSPVQGNTFQRSITKPFKKNKILNSHTIKNSKKISDEFGTSLSERNIEDKGDDGLFDFDESFRSIQDEEILDTNMEKRHPFKDFPDGGILNTDKKEIFYIGLIDILTEYGVAKKFEFLGKMIYNCSTSKMSCIPAESYQKRFIEYMNKKITE